jgi:hypothetical protein
MIAETPLCKLAQKYGTDKSPWISETSWGHSYTPTYYEKFKDIRYSVEKVLEIGVGAGRSMPRKVYKLPHYVMGASLYMWRDFFPEAMIYGIDILPECIFESHRIQTFFCDQANKSDLKKLIKKIGSDIDIVIDDGSHLPAHQVYTCLALKPLLKKDVIYVIEDVKDLGIVDKIKAKGYEVEYTRFKHKHGWDDRLLFIK